MSNYIYGFFTVNDKGVEEAISREIRKHSSIGFHVVELETIPDVSGFPRSADLTYFILSDHDKTLLSEGLMMDMDWAEEHSMNVPWRLTDRISLIVDAAKIISEQSRSAKIGLWLSESCQLEGVVEVPLASLFETICSDFETRGVPCLLYEVTPLTLTVRNARRAGR